MERSLSNPINFIGLANQTSTMPAPQLSIVKEIPSPDELRDTFAEMWEADESNKKHLVDARKWLSESLNKATVAPTLASLRLAKGWSQKKLAEVMASSQSHMARLEQGTEDVRLSTLRKLMVALDVDLNTIDAALKVQSNINVRLEP